MARDFQQLFKERQIPKQDISAGYKKLKEEAEATKNEENVTEIKLGGAEDNLTQTQQIELLTKAVADLTKRIHGIDDDTEQGGNE
ncbi:hypothetical protein [Sutcliffiella deserti]|uniref:hypothetical protein n=1 Tax=Sutcliffiella deserti TaxID=2875501 RepID=UPI001CC0117D|nr:hypothetical protein [Sutcliffiella deserti]